MTAQEIDRIECAIRHIESSLDVDPWARDIAVKAMQKQIPTSISIENGFVKCAECGKYIRFPLIDKYNNCPECGQAIDWGGRVMEKLKPCPFCGAPYPYITFEHGYIDDSAVIFCNACKISVKLEENGQEGFNKETKRKAIEAWNRRAQDD